LRATKLEKRSDQRYVHHASAEHCRKQANPSMIVRIACGSSQGKGVKHLKKIASVVAAVVAFAAVPAVSVARPTGEAVPEKVEASAHDYGFSGVKDDYAAGEYKFTFENRSKKRVHEFLLVRNKSKMSPRELLRLAQRNEEKAEKKVEFKGATFAKPEKKGEAFTTDLTPGKYFYFCFVTNSKKSPPHWKLGMLEKFTVE
jgi:uncharacterized cupredoxin-like copper-binding protein